MKISARFLIVTLLVLAALVVGTAAPAATQAQAPKEIKIGVVTDVGEIDDRSFNQSAWEGGQAAAKEVKGTANYLISKGPEDYAGNIDTFVKQGYNVIVTVGFALGDATVKAAEKNPNVLFIGVDQFQAKEIKNVVGLIFPEEEAGYLAGVLAARLSKTNTIAQVLGTDQVPPVVAFKEGFEIGAKVTKPNIKVLSTYHPGGLDKAFTDPAWGAQTAAQALDNGADVIFGAGGKTGNGALQEVAKRTTKDKQLFCIGVDTDQYLSLPEARPCLVSSAMKLINPGIVDITKLFAEGKQKGGNFVGKTGLAPFYELKALVPEAVQKEIETLSVELGTDKKMVDRKAGKLVDVAPAPAAAATAAATKAATAAK